MRRYSLDCRSLRQRPKVWCPAGKVKCRGPKGPGGSCFGAAGTRPRWAGPGRAVTQPTQTWEAAAPQTTVQPGRRFRFPGFAVELAPPPARGLPAEPPPGFGTEGLGSSPRRRGPLSSSLSSPFRSPLQKRLPSHPSKGGRSRCFNSPCSFLCNTRLSLFYISLCFIIYCRPSSVGWGHHEVRN